MYTKKVSLTKSMPQIQVYCHSVAGDTCLVDFYCGDDGFTVMLSRTAANELPFERLIPHGVYTPNT